MSENKFAYIASDELAEAYRTLVAGTQPFMDGLNEWNKQHPEYRVGVMRGSWGSMGHYRVTHFMSVPRDLVGPGKVFRKDGKAYAPYKAANGQPGRDLLATVPLPPRMLHVGGVPYHLKDSREDLGDGQSVHSWPDFKDVSGDVYVLSATEQTSDHLTPTTMSAYWAAVEADKAAS